MQCFEHCCTVIIKGEKAMDKKTLGIIGVLLVIISGCLYSVCSSAGWLDDDTITIGFLGAFTGDQASYGISEYNMAQLVVNDVNKAGGVLGKQIKLIPYDTKTRSKDAVKAVRRMIRKDGVCAILGANASGINIATAPVVNRKKIPQISTVGTNPLVTVDENGKVRPYSFRVCFTDTYQGALAAELIYGDLGFTTAAVLYNAGSDYAQGLREFFVKSYESCGGEIVADESYRDTDTDFSAQLTKIKNSGARALFLPGMGKDMALIIKQARELQLKVNFIGGDGYAEFMSEIAGDALKGSYWINHTYQEAPEMAPVFAKYRKVYHDEGKEFTDITMAYDAAKWLVDAIKRAGSTDGEAVAKALEETTKLKLTHCTISVDPATHNLINKPAVILKVGSDLKGRYYKTVSPE